MEICAEFYFELIKVNIKLCLLYFVACVPCFGLYLQLCNCLASADVVRVGRLYRPFILLGSALSSQHCWFRHMTRKIVS